MSHNKILTIVSAFSILSLTILIALDADAQVEDTKSTNAQQAPDESPILAFFSNEVVGSTITVLGFAAGIIYFAIQHSRTERHFQHQMAANAKINNAQFWISFRESLSKYDEIHINLHPAVNGVRWKPKDANEQAKVETYMGLFEHANKMLDMKLIDLETFKEIYRYRINNLISNNWVNTNKIDEYGESWLNFIRLCHKAGLQDKLPYRWKSVEMVKPDVAEFSILPELNEPIYKGVRHNIIVKVVDKASQKKIADVNVVGEITKKQVVKDQEKTVVVVMLDSENSGKSGQVTYPITINEEGKFSIFIRCYAADFTNIIPYKTEF